MRELPLSPPKTVKRAIGCIWVSFGINVLSWISLIFMETPAYLIRVLTAVHMPLRNFLIIKYAALVVSGGIVYLVLRQVAKGRDWARIICLIVGLLALPDTVYRFLGYHDAFGRMECVIWNVPYLAFGYYALYLLFTAPGKDWFQKQQIG